MKIKTVITFVLIVLMSHGMARASSEWMDDFEAASAKAKAENRFMLLDFTGSDWCGWCIKLNKEVFSKGDFEKYAAEKLVLVELDFPRKKKPPQKIEEQNRALASKYGVRGYPTIILLDPNGEQIGKTGYQDGGPKKYVEHLEAMIKPHESKFGPVVGGGNAGAVSEVVSASGSRTWTSTSGSTIDASYYRMVGNTVELRKANGKQIRIGLASLSEADQDFLRSIKAIQ